jgi:hypothetical protein
MSTRKHFVLASETISKIPNYFVRRSEAKKAIEIFSKENPRFNKERFLENCGLKDCGL